MNHLSSLTRRSFLKRGSLAAGAVTAAIPAMAAEAEKEVKPKILNQKEGMTYRRLGKTDIYLSAISLGGLVNEPGVHKYGIEKGINLCHISTSYIGGSSIVELGKLMKTHRDRVYLALKDNFLDGGESEEEAVKKVDGVLKTLNTDHVDFFMLNEHSPDDAAKPRNLNKIEKLKELGKIRFVGLTCHKEVYKTAVAGIQSGLYDIIMPVLNQPMYEELNDDLREAHKKGIGIMGMKTMRQMKGDAQIAYLKKMLHNPAITTVNKGIGSFEMVDEWAKASNEVLTSQEKRSLYQYAHATRSDNCMMCDDCTNACPNHLEISTMLRCSDYYHDECGDAYHARMTYAEIPSHLRVDHCDDCGKCEIACPNGIAIRKKLERCKTLFHTFA